MYGQCVGNGAEPKRMHALGVHGAEHSDGFVFFRQFFVLLRSMVVCVRVAVSLILYARSSRFTLKYLTDCL